MTDLELFNSTMKHQHTGRFLYKADYIGGMLTKMQEATGLTDSWQISERYGAFVPVGVALTPPVTIEQPDFSHYFSDIEIPDNAFISGLGVLEIPGSIFHFTRYISPLRNATTLKEVQDFPFGTTEGWSEDGMADAVTKAHSEGKVATSWVGHMYEEAWQIRGYEEFLMDMLACPEIPEYILDVKMNRNILNAEAAARAGVDYITTGDDVANQRALMFSKDQWKRFLKSRWAKVYEKARSIKPDIQIWYHSDGDITEIIPDLIEIGVTILNPVQPECMDLAKLKREYGKDLVFDGTIGTQTTMPFGTPDDVRNRVREAKKEYGYDGALIISPTHVLEPEVPVENVLAFFETCAE